MTKLSKKKLPYTPAQKKALLELTDELDRYFGIETHERDIYFHSEGSTKGDEIAAEVKTDSEYRRVAIRIYPTFWNNEAKQRGIYLLHEYTHTILNDLTEKAYNLIDGKLETKAHIAKANEQATSQISVLLDEILRRKSDRLIKAYNKYIKTK